MPRIYQKLFSSTCTVSDWTAAISWTFLTVHTNEAQIGKFNLLFVNHYNLLNFSNCSKPWKKKKIIPCLWTTEIMLSFKSPNGIKIDVKIHESAVWHRIFKFSSVFLHPKKKCQNKSKEVKTFIFQTGATS